MAQRSALRLTMEVATQLFIMLLLIATLEGEVEVAAANLRENTLMFQWLSEAKWIIPSSSENLQLKGTNQQTATDDTTKFSDKQRLHLKSLLERPRRSDRSNITVVEDLEAPSSNQTKRGLDSPLTTEDPHVSHHRRHNHTGVPAWLKDRTDESVSQRELNAKVSQIEDGIAAVFRGVAYGNKEYNAFTKKYPSGNRFERTTAFSEMPDYNYVADESLPVLSGRRNVALDVSNSNIFGKDIAIKVNANKTSDSSISVNESLNSDGKETNTSETTSARDSKVDLSDRVIPKVNSTKENSVLESILEVEAYDDEVYSLYEGVYSDFYSDDISKVSRRGDSLLANNLSKSVEEIVGNATGGGIGKLPMPRISWFDYLLCTNRNMAWIFVNFLLGLILLCVSVFAPYRLLTLRTCTHILPRTHFVSVHLLVFIAASLKALYMFHLAFGGQERLPLILILILTNTSIPCFISAYLILIITMFLTADVQVYKPKFLTMHNISIFIVMMIVLSFAADIIVGSAHSKSVLMLSRVMLIFIAVAVIVFYIRKHPRVIQVVHLLKREFQGELKLLVVPTKDSPQHKQMNIKYILRNRLHNWCRVINLTTVFLGVCCLIHFIHAVFLISSHVPVWVWWGAHASGACVEAAVGILLCIASALTQRYDDKASFIRDLFVPSLFSRKSKRIEAKERNGNAVYQRVSYSSGTESTQYTTCPNESSPVAGVVTSRTPKPPRRRTATVRRSATFSYAPQYPRGPGRPCQPPLPHLNVMRAGSASQIPMYSPGSASHVSDIYNPASVAHVPVYSPQSVRSMLVHEDGFVRIRTQVDPNEVVHRRSGSHLGIHEGHHLHLGSNPQIHNASVQQWNGYGSRESFYNCLPRRRRSSRSSSFHQHNSQIAETDYYPETPKRYPVDQVNIFEHVEQRPVETYYQSFPRRRHRSRESSLKQLNNIEREGDECKMNRSRRPSSRGSNFQHMNNLDRSEEDYQSLGRKLSRDDNNEPIYYNSSHEGSYHNKFPASKNSFQYPRVSPINVNDRENISPVSRQPGSPSTRNKISNVSTSPTSNFYPPSPVHTSPLGTSRREAHFPRPFAHRGSNSSLRSEDIPYLEQYQRTNPVRRNHSSAGYFPSRYLQPTDASVMDDTQRYGSLRIGMVKKRQPGYVLHTNTSKLLNKYLDKYPRAASEEDNTAAGTNEYGIPIKVPRGTEHSIRKNSEGRRTPQAGSTMEGDTRESEESQSAANTSKGSDADWALDVITSSSILTDFYSLKRPKKDKGKDDIKEEEEPAATKE